MQRPDEIQEMNQAISNGRFQESLDKFAQISAERITAARPLEANPAYVAASRGQVETLLFLAEHGVKFYDIGLPNGDTLLDVIMKKSRGSDQNGKMGLLLACLGAQFGKEDESELAYADYPHRKIFQDFFYNLSTWKRIKEDLVLYFHKACELNLRATVKLLLNYTVPDKVELQRHFRGQGGSGSIMRTQDKTSQLQQFENLEKTGLTRGMTAAHMASAPQHRLTDAQLEQVQKKLTEDRQKIEEEQRKRSMELPEAGDWAILLNARDGQNVTALHIAARFGYRDLITDLLELGADPSLKTKDGETPAQVALRNEIKQEQIQPILDMTKENYSAPKVIPAAAEIAPPVAQKANPHVIASLIKGCQGQGKPNFNLLKIFISKITEKEDWQQVYDGLLNKTKLVALLKEYLTQNPNASLNLPLELQKQVNEVDTVTKEPSSTLTS